MFILFNVYHGRLLLQLLLPSSSGPQPLFTFVQTEPGALLCKLLNHLLHVFLTGSLDLPELSLALPHVSQNPQTPQALVLEDNRNEIPPIFTIDTALVQVPP